MELCHACFSNSLHHRPTSQCLEEIMEVCDACFSNSLHHRPTSQCLEEIMEVCHACFSNSLHHRADLHHNVLRKSWKCGTLVLVTPYTTEQTYITMS